MLLLDSTCRATITSHGESTFPDECCGALLGRDHPDGTREILEVLPASNTVSDERQRRYLLDPSLLLHAEKVARESGLEVLGIYHSHPDHPSRPSEFDRQHAWPFWSYIILSVRDGVADSMQSWRLSEDRERFDEEAIGDHRPVAASG